MISACRWGPVPLAKFFESFSTVLEWIAKSKLAISGVLHLLDDFLLIDKTFSACEQNLSRFLAMCDDLGVPMAPEKTMGPSSVLCFAGIELDTDKMEARLPEEKLRKCVTLIYEFLKRKKVSLKEMQSLIGLLNFTCSVVIPGRTFLRRMIREFTPFDEISSKVLNKCLQKFCRQENATAVRSLRAKIVIVANSK